MKLYQSTGVYKLFFPRLYHFAIDNESDPVTHQFWFESMVPLIEDGNFSSIIRRNSPEKLILEGATFAVHALYELLILHLKLGFVHGDISPSNVMFSKLLNIWKLNDFNRSM